MNEENIVSKELDTLLKYMEGLVNDGLPTLTITPEYLIIAILQKRDSMAYQLLYDLVPTDLLVKIHKAFYDVASRKSLKAIRPNSEPKYNTSLENILNNASDIQLAKLGGEKLNSLHILLALIGEESEEKPIKNLLAKGGATYDVVMERAKNMMLELGQDINEDAFTSIELPPQIDEDGNVTETAIMFSDENHKPVKFSELPQNIQNMFQNLGIQNHENKPSREKKKSTVETICTNLNERAKKGLIEPLIGREKDLDRLINVLARRKKNNAIIVGDDGIGKSALCEGLAYKIVHGEVPEFLCDKTIWSLNLASMMAGTQFRGMFEGRMQSLVEELESDGKSILYIDDISSAFADKKNSDVDFGTILSSALLNGTVQVLGSCSYKGYRTSFDANPSLARKFQKIVINEPTESETYDILTNIKPYYEEYHGVIYDDNAIKKCISLARKYVPERHLPDSAIDIMDECGARESIIHDNTEKLTELKQKIVSKEKEIDDLKRNDGYDKIDAVNEELNGLNAKYTLELQHIKKDKKDHKTEVTVEQICDYVSQKTGIPINKLSNDDKKQIVSINDILKKSIIGQDEAIDAVCKAIKRNRVGLGLKKTMGSFLMIGKTGVGKSLLAKTLAKEIFGDEKYLVRIDMSEYEDKTSVNKLIGSSAGYVGYENGGVLTEAIKNKKYCVLLLDEFEKASPEVYNLFLQVFDEGFLSDNTGQRIDFKNIIVILTSNVGAKAAMDFGRAIGFEREDKSRKVLEKELKDKFSPEFLNRLDDIVYFNSLDEENMHKIIRLELEKLNDRLKNIGHIITYDDNVVQWIYAKNDEKEYGARPIIRIIQNYIENPITDLLLENDYKEHNFNITCNTDDSLSIN